MQTEQTAALPELPKPKAVGVWGYTEPTTFTEEQMREYAIAAAALATKPAGEVTDEQVDSVMRVAISIANRYAFVGDAAFPRGREKLREVLSTLTPPAQAADSTVPVAWRVWNDTDDEWQFGLTRLEACRGDDGPDFDSQPEPLYTHPIAAEAVPSASCAPIDMVLHCPSCGEQHVDAPEQADADVDVDGSVISSSAAWDNPPHRSHLCHACGHIWRPADVPTNGVLAVKTVGKNDRRASNAAEPAGGEAVALCARIMGLVDEYHEHPHRNTRYAIRAALMDDWAPNRATPPQAPAVPAGLSDAQIERLVRFHCGGINTAWSFTAGGVIEFARDIAALAASAPGAKDPK